MERFTLLRAHSVLLIALLYCLAGPSRIALADEPAKDLVTLFNGNLIQVEDGQVVESRLEGSPKYFVLYHSASW